MSENTDMKVYTLAGGEIAVWRDPSGAVCIKILEPHGDPVELAEHEALELSAILKKLAEDSQ
jgi:hypothetical protein